MNNSNRPPATNESETALHYIKVSDLIFEFGINGVSSVGSVVNIITILLLTNKKFDHKFYNFLRCRCICNLAVCLVGIFIKTMPKKDMVVEYLPLFYQWFVINLPARVFFYASSLSDNLLILNRLANLDKKRDSIFFSLSKKVSFQLNQFY